MRGRKNGSDERTRNLVKSALMAAIICVATILVQVPTPATGGYVHFGDSFCLIAAWLLPPVWSMAAAGIGTMLADFLSGYAVYAPASLLIKAGIAAIVWLVYRVLCRKQNFVLPCLISGILGEMWMILGYFLFNAWIRGKGLAALASVPENAMQAGFGVAVATIVWIALQKVKVKK